MTDVVNPRISPAWEQHLRYSATAACYLVLTIPALALFILVAVSIPLVLITAGVFVLAFAVPLTRRFTDLHRRLAGEILGSRIESPYRSTEGMGPISRMAACATDNARWRDFAFLFVSATVGFALAVITVIWLPATIWYVIAPIVTFGNFWNWLLAPISFLIWWFGTPLLLQVLALLSRSLLGPTRAQRLAAVESSRTETIDHSAAEVRRIERDLHDGAQARMVSVGMSVGLASELVRRDPKAASELLAEASVMTKAALEDLRMVVRGIRPPVLADRGLVGALEALSLDLSLPVTVTADLAGRPPDPVESAAYFAAAECLANVVKHSSASQAWVRIAHDGAALWLQVGDDGVGGADATRGTGLAGIIHRLDAFDGRIGIDSPVGGPTIVTMEVPCALS